MGRGSLWTLRFTPSRRRSWRAPASSCLTTLPSVWQTLSGTEISRMKQKSCHWDLRSGRHLNNQPVESLGLGKWKDGKCLQLPVQAGGAGRGQANQLDKGLQMLGRGGRGRGLAAEAGVAEAGRCLHRGEAPPCPGLLTTTSARSALSWTTRRAASCPAPGGTPSVASGWSWAPAPTPATWRTWTRCRAEYLDCLVADMPGKRC